MVSVEKVYNTVKDLANKEQKGFITPAVFNNFASLAQKNVFNEIFSDIAEAKKLTKQGLDPSGALSVVNQKKSDLSDFLSTIPLESGAFLPNDFYQESFVVDPSGLTHQIEVDVEKYFLTTRSHLSKGTEALPVFAIVDGQFLASNNNSSSTYFLYYYRIPVNPSYAVLSFSSDPNATFEQFDPTQSINFELPSSYENEIIAEILKMIGVRLRDTQLSQFAVAEEASE